MYGQFEIYHMAVEAERQLLDERSRHLHHLQRWRDAHPGPLRSWLRRRPHVRTVTVRLPVLVLAAPPHPDC